MSVSDIVHPTLGRPDVVYEYDVGIICRWHATADRPKEIRPAVRDGTTWRWQAMPEPRPLYHLPDLLVRPEAQVLVVEGEKCADAGHAALPSLVTVSWCGGGNAVRKTDWSPLRGRRVIVWPDNDEPGAETAIAVAGLALDVGVVSVKVLRRPGLDGPDARPKGWDIADAVAEGWDGARIIAWARSRAVEFTAEKIAAWRNRKGVMPSVRHQDQSSDTRPRLATVSQAAQAVAATSMPTISPTIGAQPRASIGNITALRPGTAIPPAHDPDNWRSNLMLNEDGILRARLAQNFEWMLRCHHETAGIFAWNQISEAVFLHRAPPWGDHDPAAKWSPRRLIDNDIFGVRTWMERRGLHPHKSETSDTIYAVSAFHAYNPVREYLDALKWDGCPRLAGGAWEGDTVTPLATEYLGAPDDPIYGEFLTKWHIAAVARIMRPGCQVDNMIVLESPQGRRKSSYVRAMSTVNGVEYFCDDVGDISNKDSIIRLHGCWLVEIGELAKVRHADIEVTKSWVTRRSDRYRPPYEREVKDVARHFVLAASVNPSGYGYLRDPTGNRRFWPVPIREIDIGRISSDRDQIWAEAVHYYRKKMSWWATAEQELRVDELTGDRRSEDPWAAKIDRWLSEPEQVHGLANGGITLDTVIAGIGIPIGQQNEWTAKRVAEHMKEAGLVRCRVGTKRVWRREPVEPLH